MVGKRKYVIGAIVEGIADTETTPKMFLDFTLTL